MANSVFSDEYNPLSLPALSEVDGMGVCPSDKKGAEPFCRIN
jgi:hypothetical protein